MSFARLNACSDSSRPVDSERYALPGLPVQRMKFQLHLSVIIVALLLPTFGCAHMSDPCDNKLLHQVPSPDGNLMLATYHRECRSKVYTVATVEKPAGFLRSRGEVVCYLMSWGDRHPVEAVWKTGDTIFISTTDRLEQVDVHDSKESCSGIKVNYDVRFRNERQQTDDSEVIAKIRNVLSDVGPCVNDFYKAANSANDPVGYMNELVNRGEHRSTVELILGYTSDAACPISPGTYDSLKELSETFELKTGYLERVTHLIRR